MYFVSKLGTVHTSALAIGANTFIVINVFSALFATGVLAITARRVGENELEEVPAVAMAGMRLAALIGIIMLIISYGREALLIGLMYNTNAVTTQYIVEYLRTLMFFVPFVYISSALRSSLHALGDTRTPLYIFGFSNVVNMILDPIFIFKLDMGIRGAALATGISITIAFILILRIGMLRCYAGRISNLLRAFFSKRLGYIKKILEIGVWDAVQQIARPLTGVLMFRFVYQVGGDPATAAFGIGGQLVSYTFIFLSGLSIAVSVMVGQKLGEGNKDAVDDIVSFAFKIAAFNMAVFAIPYFIFPDLIFRFFTEQPGVIEEGVRYLRIVYGGIIFAVIPIVYSGALKGAGYTFGPMVASISANLIFKVTAGYVLAVVMGLGSNGIWMAIALSVIVEAVMIKIMEARKDWKSIKI
jgi:putative MATE family efflux protein